MKTMLGLISLSAVMIMALAFAGILTTIISDPDFISDPGTISNLECTKVIPKAINL